MKFKLKNTDYRIRFMYLDQRITMAKIEPVRYDSIETTPVGVGVAVRNPSDRHVKEIARKICLERAVNSIALNRQERSVVWNAYWNRNQNNNSQNKRNVANYT